MGYKEHIKDETRTTEDFLKIKLHKEGNFWGAYEWSAYLSRLFPSDLNEIDRLKPLKKSFYEKILLRLEHNFLFMEKVGLED